MNGNWLRLAGLHSRAITESGPLVRVNIDDLSAEFGSAVAAELGEILLGSAIELDQMARAGSADPRIRAVLALHARSRGAWVSYRRLLPTSIRGMDADYALHAGQFGRLRKIALELTSPDDFSTFAMSRWFSTFAISRDELSIAKRLAAVNVVPEALIPELSARVRDASKKLGAIVTHASDGLIIASAEQSPQAALIVALICARASRLATDASIWYNLGVAQRNRWGNGAESYLSADVCYRKSLTLIKADQKDRETEKSALGSLIRSAIVEDRVVEVATLYRIWQSKGYNELGVDGNLPRFAEKHRLSNDLSEVQADDFQLETDDAQLADDEHWSVMGTQAKITAAVQSLVAWFTR